MPLRYCNLFISHGVGETLIINHEHHVQCINLTQILPESPAEIAMPNVLDYMQQGSFKHNSNEYDDNDVSNNSIRSPLLASTLISAYILRMPELFETAKKQLANIIYDEDNFHKDDITKIVDYLMCLQETVSTKSLKYIMNALCFAKKMHHQNQFNKTSAAAASTTTTTTRKVARRVSFSPALNNNNDKNGRKRLDLNILEISNGKNNSNKKKYDSNSSKRRATVSLNSKSKNLSDKDSRNTRRYFSEKHDVLFCESCNWGNILGYRSRK